MARENDGTPLKELINKYLDSINIKSKIFEINIKEHWEKVMGTFIAQKTKDISLKEGVLTLKIDSPIIKNELKMGKSKIIDLLHQEIGQKCISEINIR